MTEYFTTKYKEDIAAIFSLFHDLQKVHKGNFVMYYDGTTWEIFDCLLCTTVIKYTPKQLSEMRKAIYKLTHDIANVSCMHLPGNRHFRQSCSCSLRNLKQIYPDTYSYFLPYGKADKK